jgi:hypothetical protein
VQPGDGARAITQMTDAGAQPVHVDHVGLLAEVAELA